MNHQLPSLRDLLILCPTLAGLDPFTELFLREADHQGARVIRTSGCSEVAFHRCRIASIARDVLEQDDSRRWVCWIDGDVVGTAWDLAHLCLWVQRAGEATRRARPDWPAISGQYVQRTRPKLLSARQLPDEQPLTVQESNEPPAQLPPVYAGMGCLCQTVEAFLNHCEESAEVPHDNSTMPCVTASGPLKKQDGTIIWAPEDFTYCACEWNAGRGVYLAPVRFGHVGRVVLYPDDEVELDF